MRAEGVNLDADQWLCDLSTLDKMIFSASGGLTALQRIPLSPLSLMNWLASYTASDLQNDGSHINNLNPSSQRKLPRCKKKLKPRSQISVKQSLEKERKVKAEQHKKLAKNGVDYGQKETERECSEGLLHLAGAETREIDGKVSCVAASPARLTDRQPTSLAR
ncbi:MAG: hypothetical protein U0Y68_02810 [Blastocatellia bacterium]